MLYSEHGPSRFVQFHQVESDEGFGRLEENGAFEIGFNIYPANTTRGDSRASDFHEPGYESWVKSFTLEHIRVLWSIGSGLTWHEPKKVSMTFPAGGDTVVQGFCLYSSSDFVSFEAIPPHKRLANRRYTFYFDPVKQNDRGRLKISYALRRPDGTREIIERTIEYGWQKYEYWSYE